MMNFAMIEKGLGRLGLLFLLVLSPSLLMAQHSLVMDESTSIESSLTEASWRCMRRVMISDEKGTESAFWSCVADRNTKLKSFVATYRDAHGKVLKKLKKNDLRMTEFSRDLGTENCTYFVDYTPVVFPFDVTFEWEMENKGAVIAYPAFCPMTDYDLPVRHASYQIHCLPDNPCRYMASHCDSLLAAKSGAKEGSLTIVKQQDGTIKAEFFNLKPLKKEEWGLPLVERLPIVRFAPNQFEYLETYGRLDTWLNFGKWQYGLIKNRDELPEPIKAKVHELTGHCATKMEKIAQLYQYLYANTRYVSIQLGIGGYQPFTAQEVAAKGFGDCKGLSNYMIALLKEAGIPAFYAAISTEYADLLKDFPNMNQLNHAIVGVPMDKDTLWLECTNARYPLGYVHEGIAGHQAVVISAEGGKVVRLPKYKDTDNQQMSQCHIALHEDGSAMIQCEMKNTNRQYEQVLPLFLLDARKQKEIILANYHFPAPQLKSFKMVEEKGKPVAQLQIEVNSGRYSEVTGKRLFFSLNPLKYNFTTWQIGNKRTTPIVVDFGYCDEEKVNVTLPEGFEVESLPKDKNIESKMFSFSSHIELDGTNIQAVYRLVVHQGAYSARYEEELATIKNEITKYFRQQAVIVKK